MSKAIVKSPSYPSVSLENALESVGKIEQDYRTTPADRADAAKLIGYSSLSGPANKALAALASYGLVERAGKGMMRVTPLARAILHPNSDGERTDAVIQAATTPSLFKDIMEHFDGLAVPPESGVVNFLNRAGFNPTAVPSAAKAFLATARMIEQLEVSESHGDEVEDGAELNLPDEKFGGASIGDLIQWESRGVLQFQTPQKVRWVSDDGTHLAVEGSDTGIPMEQVTVQSASAPVPPQIPPVETLSEAPSAGQRKAVFPVSEGDVTFIFPAGMTLDGIEELEAYLAVFLKKEKRVAAIE